MNIYIYIITIFIYIYIYCMHACMYVCIYICIYVYTYSIYDHAMLCVGGRAGGRVGGWVGVGGCKQGTGTEVSRARVGGAGTEGGTEGTPPKRSRLMIYMQIYLRPATEGGVASDTACERDSRRNAPRSCLSNVQAERGRRRCMIYSKRPLTRRTRRPPCAPPPSILTARMRSGVVWVRMRMRRVSR